MLLAIEGPRGVGKSTTIKGLKDFYESKGLSVAVIDHDPEPRSTLCARLIEFVQADDAQVIIHDRFHLSEFVYSLALERRGLAELAFEMQMVELAIQEQRIKGNGVFTIVLEASQSIIANRQLTENKAFDIPIDLSLAYYRLAASLTLSSVIVNNNGESCVEAINERLCISDPIV